MPDLAMAVLSTEHSRRQDREGCQHSSPQIWKSPFLGQAPAAADTPDPDPARGDACLGGYSSGLTHYAAGAPSSAAMISGSQPTELQPRPESRGEPAADAVSGASQGTRCSGAPQSPRLPSSGGSAPALQPLDASPKQLGQGQGLLPDPEASLSMEPGPGLPAPGWLGRCHMLPAQALRAQLRAPSGRSLQRPFPHWVFICAHTCRRIAFRHRSLLAKCCCPRHLFQRFTFALATLQRLLLSRSYGKG